MRMEELNIPNNYVIQCVINTLEFDVIQTHD